MPGVLNFYRYLLKRKAVLELWDRVAQFSFLIIRLFLNAINLECCVTETQVFPGETLPGPVSSRVTLSFVE